MGTQHIGTAKAGPISIWWSSGAIYFKPINLPSRSSDLLQECQSRVVHSLHWVPA